MNATARMEKLRIRALRARKVNAQRLHEIEQKSAGRALTEKQRMFVRYWSQGETPRTAAIMAGYSETSSRMGWTLSHDPAILKLYLAEKKLYEEAEQHTKKRVMAMLQEAYDVAKLVSEPASMVAAARELGKMAGHYEPETKNININVNGQLLNRISVLPDDKLLEIINSTPDAIPGIFKRVLDDPQLPSP